MSLDPIRLRARKLYRRLRRPASLMSYSVTRLSYELGRAEVPALPVAVAVEPINVCNFRCAHCQVTHWHKPRHELGVDAFRGVLAGIPSLWRVKLQGMGEPLLCRGLLPMLEEGDARGLEMVVITNGSALNEEKARRLCEIRNLHVVVSMDGATAPVFEQARVGGRFEQVVGNARRLLQLRNGSPYPVVELHSVMTVRNLHELTDIVRLGGDLGADRLTVQLALTDWGKPQLSAHARAIEVDAGSTEIAAKVGEAARVARELGIGFHVLGTQRSSRDRPCAAPWTTAFIAANGDVVPCDNIADSDTVRMGNVFERPFAEIWNGAAYRKLREQIRSHELPPYCQGCYADVPASMAQEPWRSTA